MSAMTKIKSIQELGEALRAARKRLGLTQPRLALAAGVGVSGVGRVGGGVVGIISMVPSSRSDGVYEVMAVGMPVMG